MRTVSLQAPTTVQGPAHRGAWIKVDWCYPPPYSERLFDFLRVHPSHVDHPTSAVRVRGGAHGRAAEDLFMEGVPPLQHVQGILVPDAIPGRIPVPAVRPDVVGDDRPEPVVAVKAIDVATKNVARRVQIRA